MWQIIITVLLVAAALVYFIRSLTRSAKGDTCSCGTATCSLPHGRKQTGLPCQNTSQVVSAESLEESARNLRSGRPT